MKNCDKSTCSKAKVEFPELCFTKPGVYTYVVRETTPSCGNWQTDENIFRVIITITKDCSGKLNAEICYRDGRPVFVNRYCKPKPCLEFAEYFCNKPKFQF
ncbi:MAG: hypothetical protein FWC41_12200 [Firmicutes bacterium]|nr:hypothetical protein [Bacillota bacterium]